MRGQRPRPLDYGAEYQLVKYIIRFDFAQLFGGNYSDIFFRRANGAHSDGVQRTFVVKYTSDGTLPNVLISGALQEQAA